MTKAILTIPHFLPHVQRTWHYVSVCGIWPLKYGNLRVESDAEVEQLEENVVMVRSCHSLPLTKAAADTTVTIIQLCKAK
jgi:hypothetical protein